MAQGYYTLTEAAQFLNMPVDELKQMAQKGQIRSFQDRGTLRFRIQDIQELARKRGVSSDPELVLGDASLPAPKSSGKPSSGTKKKAPTSPKTPAKQENAPDVFDFDFDGDNVDLAEDVPVPSSGSKSKPGSKGRKPVTPQVGSDSDVRLVADGSDVTFSVPKDSGAGKPADSDVKISPDPLKPRTGIHPPSSTKRPSQLALGSDIRTKSQQASSAAKQASPKPGSGPQPMDSGVRLVPIDDDSDVKLLGASDDVPLGDAGEASASDSNVRLEKAELPPADSGEGMLLTEEINLDEEIRKQQELDKDQPSTKLKAKSQLKVPSSPFELSDSDLELPSELKEKKGPKTPRTPKTPAQAKPEASDSSDFDLAAHQPQAQDGSSDFDLVPADDGSILLEGDSGDFSLEVGEEGEQALQEEDANTELTGSSSGLTLDNPADEGISLEQTDDDSSDFDLSLEPEDTPRPQASQPASDSSDFEMQAVKTPRPGKKKKPKAAENVADSSEFELSLDSDADSPALSDEEKDDSNFDINLEGSGEGEASEDSSEFELTLDDNGNLAAEDEPAAPQVKSRKKPAASADEQDIFDTDFEVPAIDESDDATVADSELESSDFDLALDDSELASEEESGSQVVALDEEESETVADDGAVVDDVDVEEESSEFSDLDEDVEVEDVDAEDVEVEGETQVRVERETVVKEKMIEPAQWGVLPIIFMLPCVIIMVLVGILGFEIIQSTAGMRPPGALTVEIGDAVGFPVSLKK